MPKKKRPLIPPLSLKALEEVEQIEAFSRNGLRQCDDTFKFNHTKAVNILRTCVVEVLEIKLEYYSSLASFQQGWLLDIGHSTITSAIGLITTSIEPEFYDQLEDILYKTVNAHLQARRSPQQAQALPPKPLRQQIDNLRCECGMTVEELAEALGLTPRSVYRHLAGKAIPRKTQLAAYSRIFSEKLKRKITLTLEGQQTS